MDNINNNTNNIINSIDLIIQDLVNDINLSREHSNQLNECNNNIRLVLAKLNQSIARLYYANTNTNTNFNLDSNTINLDSNNVNTNTNTNTNFDTNINANLNTNANLDTNLNTNANLDTNLNTNNSIDTIENNLLITSLICIFDTLRNVYETIHNEIIKEQTHHERLHQLSYRINILQNDIQLIQFEQIQNNLTPVSNSSTQSSTNSWTPSSILTNNTNNINNTNNTNNINNRNNTYIRRQYQRNRRQIPRFETTYFTTIEPINTSTNLSQNTNRRNTNLTQNIYGAFVETIFSNILTNLVNVRNVDLSNNIVDNIPTAEQILNSTREIRFGNIRNPINNQCPISYIDFDENSIVKQIIYCGHIFDSNYLSTWFSRSSRCPVCRYDIMNINNTNTRNNTNNEYTFANL